MIGSIRLVFSCALVLLAAGVQVPAQTLEQKLDTLKEFRRFYRKFKEIPDKVEAIHTLVAADCAEAADELLKLMGEKEPELRAAARKVISRFTEPATFAGMVEELGKSKDPAKRAAILEILGLARFQPAVPALSLMLEERGLTPEVRFHLVRTLGILEARSEALKITPFLKDSEFGVRIAACDALAALRVRETGPEIVPLLRDQVWQVKAAAIKAVAAIRVQEAVDTLIEMVGEEGRFRIDASEALFQITLYDYGTDQATWKRNWENLKSLGFRIPTDEEVAKATAARLEASKRYKDLPGGKTYHGIPTTSTNVLFIIDVSGSMADLVVEREKFKQAGYESFEKLEIVKVELMNTIRNLDDTTNFNILAFATKVRRWKEWLVPANITNRAAAISFVKGLKPLGAREDTFGGAMGGSVEEGKTNTFGALAAAFDFDPARDIVLTGGAVPRNKLDTVFFLSDGRPSTGRYVDTSEILNEVRKINETRKVVLHAIAIGEFQKDFLERLAQENGGVFVDLGN